MISRHNLRDRLLTVELTDDCVIAKIVWNNGREEEMKFSLGAYKSFDGFHDKIIRWARFQP